MSWELGCLDFQMRGYKLLSRCKAIPVSCKEFASREPQNSHICNRSLLLWGLLSSRTLIPRLRDLARVRSRGTRRPTWPALALLSPTGRMGTERKPSRRSHQDHHQKGWHKETASLESVLLAAAAPPASVASGDSGVLHSDPSSGKSQLGPPSFLPASQNHIGYFTII